MKRFSYALTLVLVLGVFLGPLYGGTFTFAPIPSDMGDLNHSYFYLWKVKWNIPAGEKITQATIFIDNINNWAIEQDILYINLLDDPFPFKYWAKISSTGNVWYKYDNQRGGNNFNGYGILLTTFSDQNQYLNGSKWVNPPEDWTYNFNSSQISTLTGTVKYFV